MQKPDDDGERRGPRYGMRYDRDKGRKVLVPFVKRPMRTVIYSDAQRVSRPRRLRRLLWVMAAVGLFLGYRVFFIAV